MRRVKQQCKSTATPQEERTRIASVNVTLSWPSNNSSSGDATTAASAPKGVAFLLTGAMINISEYNGLRDVILEQHHLVVSLYVNVMRPLRNNHRKHAQDVKKVFDELQSMYDFLPNSYSIIGHSAGGKIALIVASIIDPQRVSAVLALDPVDINPIEFSNAKGPNLPFIDDDILCSDFEDGANVVHVVKHREQMISKEDEENKKRSIPILLTCTDGGRGIPKNHDAEAIDKLHPATKCYHHANAGHMAYCDNGGGFLAGRIMPDVGTTEGNQKAREAAHDLIREILGS